MAAQTVDLSEVIGFKIPVDEKWTCLASTKRQKRCRHPVAKESRETATEILQHKMTFQESEHDLIQHHIEKLLDLLFHKDNHGIDVELQIKKQKTEWLDRWRTELENRTRPRRQSFDSAIALEDPEQFSSEPAAMLADHAPHEIAGIPALVRYPTLPIEPTPVPTDAPVCTTTIASYLNRTITLNNIENVSDQTGEVATISQHCVLGHDAPLEPNQTSSHENLGLTVFFSPNQLEIINIILQFGLQLCAFFQIQYGAFISRDSIGNKRTESFLRFRLIFGAEFTLSEILTSPLIMLPLAVTLGQLLYIIIGPWSSSMLLVFAVFVGSCWTGTKERAIVRKAERV